MVLQTYSIYVPEEHVILGNAAVLRCHIPSFVADTVHVDHWLVDERIVAPSSSAQSGTYEPSKQPKRKR